MEQRSVTVQSSMAEGVNPITPEELQQMKQVEDPLARIYDVGVGKYDLVVTVGPSYSTKRQEAVASMLELAKTFPPLVEVAGDLLVKNMDWPGAQNIAKRLRIILPPQIQESLDEEGNSMPNPIPFQIQQQLQQLQAMNEELTNLVQQLTEEKEKK